jgi:hypothetical protein
LDTGLIQRFGWIADPRLSSKDPCLRKEWIPEIAQRVGHFFGLHSIQVAAILLAISLMLPLAFRIPLIVVGNITWLGFIGLVTWQSLRAEPFSSPSEMTISSFVALAVLATILFAVLSLSQSKAQAKTRP